MEAIKQVVSEEEERHSLGRRGREGQCWSSCILNLHAGRGIGGGWQKGQCLVSWLVDRREWIRGAGMRGRNGGMGKLTHVINVI